MNTATTSQSKASRVCPACHSRAVARSRRRAIYEQFASIIGVFPYRCRDCFHRFWAL
jgi:hypothetical protein